MEQNNIIAIIREDDLKELIYEIRGQKVMLDVDLAKIYGYSTKAFNQQVKNNIGKFDEDFRFQLLREELDFVRSKFLTSRNDALFTGQSGGTRYLPYAFTEQGIYMLMTVLKGDLAVRQSKALIRIFKEMKDYIAENRALLDIEDIAKLALQTSENTSAIAKINDEMLKKTDLPNIFKNFASTDIGKEFLIMNGKLAEADAVYQDIYSKAKHSIYIIDDYISIKTLLHLSHDDNAAEITVFSDNKQNHLRKSDVNDFRSEYPTLHLNFKRTNSKIHDRYIVLDYGKRSEKIYHCGASSKDAGKRTTTIMEVSDRSVYKPVIEELLRNQPLFVELDN